MGAWWLSLPWRMIQTNLREIDFRDMDPQRFAADLEVQHATVAMISTSGIVANYPTRLPYQHRNPYASDTVLRDIIDACHDRGIRVIGRMDFSKIREPMSSQHPEWAFVGEEGERICYNGDTHVCCNSEYQRVLSLNILRETLEMLPIDGVFFNFGGYTSGFDYSGHLYGDCVCENCKRRFVEMYGQPLPAHPADSPLYAEFQRVTQEQASREIRKTIAAVRPDLCIANDLYSARGFFRAEAGSGHGQDWTYSASELALRVRTGYPDMIASITTVDFIDIAYRYASPGEERQTLRLAQSLAHGGSPDLYIMGRLDNREDQAGKRAAKRMFAYHRRHPTEYRWLMPLGDVLLVRPGSHWLLGGDAIQEYCAWYEMLTQAHYSFRAVDENRLSTLTLADYKAILLPAISLSAGSESILSAYLRAGGRVLATRGNSLPKWLGGQQITEEITDTRGSYARPPHHEPRVLPIVGGYARCLYAPEAELRGQIIAPHPFGPPERCYYTESDVTDDPVYTVVSHGAGRAIWVPWRPGISFSFGHQPALARWMRSLLEEEMSIAPLHTDAPACVEITLCEGRDGLLLVHLINESGAVSGIWDKPLPMPPVTLHIPCKKPLQIRSLEEDPIEWHWQDGLLTIQTAPKKVLTAIAIKRC